MMTPLFRVVLVVVSLGTCAVLNSKIRRAKIRIEEAVFWILLSLMFVLFAILPRIPDTLAALLGIYSTANFLFLFMIFILLLKLFQMSLEMGVLEEKVKTLVQELALRDRQERDGQEREQGGGKGGGTRGQDGKEPGGTRAERMRNAAVV